MQQFTFSTVIHAPREQVFYFHDNPENLLLITPPYIRVAIDRFDDPQQGALIYLTVYPLPLLKTTWVMEISRYEPTTVFEDTMRSGPFAYWRHTREFSSSNGEATTIVETVQYKMPFGFLGKIVDAMGVDRMNRNMFSYRQKRMKELLEAPD